MKERRVEIESEEEGEEHEEQEEEDKAEVEEEEEGGEEGEHTFPWRVSALSPTIHHSTHTGPNVTLAGVLELFLKVVGAYVCSRVCNRLKQENGRG